jgi:hypothetical protein
MKGTSAGVEMNHRKEKAQGKPQNIALVLHAVAKGTKSAGEVMA